MITLSWGGSLELVTAADLPGKLADLARQKIEAVAWRDEFQTRECGWVKLLAGQFCWQVDGYALKHGGPR